ncbi:MAG: helix-turn-helix domain-containing protein [Proteobacteria bacterium]|nr:helix-turn-helix domain-containing protein [Pseudomonadota bacterium]
MDASIDAAARALAAGDSLTALRHIALRDEPAALALRGIAMAQLGEYPRARELLRRAARRFGHRAPAAHARCVVAEAEVALAMREFTTRPRTLVAAAQALAHQGDHANAMQARLIAARGVLLLGRLDAASGMLHDIDAQGLPPALRAVAALLECELALRMLRVAAAQAALASAESAARAAAVPQLVAEVAEMRTNFARPAARLLTATSEQSVRLDEVAALMTSEAWVLDACRHGVRRGGQWTALTRRPVLFAIARALATAWPREVPRGVLIATVFNTRRPDDSHRARLRVEVGRLRALLAPAARITATAGGFALELAAPATVVVLAPPMEGQRASLLALLADGAAWSTSALALALNASQRTVQRALVELLAEGRVRTIGRARTQRWLAPPLAGFTPILLLPAVSPAA